MTVELAVLVAAAGLLVGVLSALFGVGGGLLMVPFMVLVLDQPQHLAEGTSLLVIVPTAIAGVLAHRRRGYVSFRHGLLLAAGGVGGAVGGAAIALNLSGSALQAAFAAFMVVAGARTVHRGVRRMRGDRATAIASAPTNGPEHGADRAPTKDAEHGARPGASQRTARSTPVKRRSR